MARYIRLAGLASILVVDQDHDIDALLDHPNLERDYTLAGPLLNRIIVARIRRAICVRGRVLLSFRPRADGQRQTSQRELSERLDALAARRPWAPEALAAMATYAMTGTRRDTALAALAYVTAYPFMDADDDGKSLLFVPAKFKSLYRLYRLLSRARRPWAGLPIRVLGLDRIARERILLHTRGDEYGLHALDITLDNSRLMLEHLRTLTSQRQSHATRDRPSFDWRRLRTAPQLVLRQTTKPCTLPGVADHLPRHTLVLLRMRQALRSDSGPGFEFASAHWSACPARRYVMAAFAAVCDVMEPLEAKGAATRKLSSAPSV